MLASKAGVESLLEALEVRFLANRGDNLYFGLLTDFADAPAATMPEDDGLLALARHGIEELNQKYHGASCDPFFLFQRPRVWESRDKIWMGYERKRGKLAALNALLRPPLGLEEKNVFTQVVGDTSVLPGIKYVITLDTDTQLPREAAWQCVGTMAHPLNRARYNAEQTARVRRLRNPAAARRTQFARSQSLQLRPHVRRRSRHRSLHARRLRRLSRRLRRRLLHRQRHLRRRRLRAIPQRTLPGKPHPQPRSCSKAATPAPDS